MIKTGIYGGTFDPIHNGHLITAQYVLEERNLDQIVFMPNNVSPMKIGRNSASTDDRLEMLKLALEPVKEFTYSSYEIDKGDVSYTVDTLREIKSEYEYLLSFILNHLHPYLSLTGTVKLTEKNSLPCTQTQFSVLDGDSN